MVDISLTIIFGTGPFLLMSRIVYLYKPLCVRKLSIRYLRKLNNAWPLNNAWKVYQAQLFSVVL